MLLSGGPEVRAMEDIQKWLSRPADFARAPVEVAAGFIDERLSDYGETCGITSS
jgi:hypothetical protein